MEELTFITTKGEELKMGFDLNEKMKIVCKKYANRIGEKYSHLVFFVDGQKFDKKITLQELKQNNGNKDIIILVKIMDILIEYDSDEENASKELITKILEDIKDPNKTVNYDQAQELILQYGFNIENKIEEEIKENPQNFIDIKEAIKQKDTKESLFVLGKLGEALENMGIKVAIDKTDKKNNEAIIINQFISSGILKKNKYELHIEEDNLDKQYKIINNIDEQNKFKEEWIKTICNYVEGPKEDIFISNIRSGVNVIKMDVIFKKTVIEDKNGKIINIDERMKKFSNTHPKIISVFVKNILGACKLSLDMLDPRGNKLPEEWSKEESKRGGVNYNPPGNNWSGYGLKVLDEYDNGDNDWITKNGNPKEWAVAYHGTCERAVKPIVSKEGKFFSTSKEGAIGQKCKNYPNINYFSKEEYPKCGEGTYCSPYISYAEKYSRGVVIMCRVDPKKIRVPKGYYSEDEWITDGTKNTIRPYRLLYKK